MKPTYFLSDLHAGAAHGDGDGRLIRFLRALKGEARTVYLVGDVFEFWLGYKSSIFSSAFPVLRVLAELVESGVEVVVFSGNHDPDPGHFFESIGVTVHEGPLAVELDGHRLWIEHGDTIDPRSRFQRVLCRTVRHPLIRWLARQLHPDSAWKLGALYGKKSEEYTEPLPSALQDVYFRGRIEAGYDTVIIGHYHRAVRHEVHLPGRPARFYVLGDWVSQYTYLKYDGVFQLLRDTEGGPPEPLGPGDHGPQSPSP